MTHVLSLGPALAPSIGGSASRESRRSVRVFKDWRVQAPKRVNLSLAARKTWRPRIHGSMASFSRCSYFPGTQKLARPMAWLVVTGFPVGKVLCGSRTSAGSRSSI